MQVQVLFPAPNKEAASDGRFFVFTTSTLPSSRNQQMNNRPRRIRMSISHKYTFPPHS